MVDELVLSVSDFVAVFNQTVEYSYPSVNIIGELANFRVSKNKWVYFDLKDEYSTVKFFGTVYQLPGPLEDGLMLQVRGTPRLHNQFGFSITVQSMQPVGEGSIKKAAAMLEAKLQAEGLFDADRKRMLPYPPQSIGLITSGESAAYHDFLKILNARWGGATIWLADVQVQGEPAPAQIVAAVDFFNSRQSVDVLVITRGGGSAEDLAAVSSEQVTRAVASSRIPTLVAVGHEIDVCLAELAADKRASTPSNAAELLVPDKAGLLNQLAITKKYMNEALGEQVRNKHESLQDRKKQLVHRLDVVTQAARQKLASSRQLLEVLNPEAALRRGYAILREDTGKVVRSGKQLVVGQTIEAQVVDATITAVVKEVTIEP